MRGKEKMLSLLPQQLWNGFVIGITYSLIAVGFSLMYGVLQLINFAHGAFFLLGAYLAMTLATFSVNLYISITLSVCFTGALGVMMNLFILQPIRKRSETGIGGLIATLGIGTFITNLIIVIFGSETKVFPEMFGNRRFNLGSVIVVQKQILIAISAVVVMIFLWLFVYRTKIGSAIRAISQNPTAALLMGIPVNRVISSTFFVGTVCAVIAGSLVGSYYGGIDTTMYLAVSLKTFAAVVLGGVGSIFGSMLSGLIIGILETLVAGYISSDYREGVAFVILIAVLIFRPVGLFGRESAERV
jgi:branched-chain amino acid transport system permease protein